jgi:hypothetical protein
MRRSRVTNNPISRANQDTADGRRVADLFRAFIREMGDRARSVTAQTDALAAAELTVAVEAARARLLSGTPGSADEVVRLGGELRRAVRRLGIDRAASAPTSIRDRLLRDQQQRGGM